MILSLQKACLGVATAALLLTTACTTAPQRVTPDEPRAWALQNYRQYSDQAASVTDAEKQAEIENFRQGFQKTGYRTNKYEKSPTTWQEALASLQPDGTFNVLQEAEQTYFPNGEQVDDDALRGEVEQFEEEAWHCLGKMAHAVMLGEVDAKSIYTEAYLKAIVHYGELEINRSNFISRFHESCFHIPTSAMNIYYTFLDRMDAVEKGEEATELEKDAHQMLMVLALQSWTQPIRKDATDENVVTIERFRQHVWWVGGNGVAFRSLLPVACMFKSIPMIDLLAEVSQRGLSCTSQNTFDTSFWTEGFTADGAGWGHGMQCLIWGYPILGTSAALRMMSSFQGTVWEQKISTENKEAILNFVRGSNFYYYKGYSLPCLSRHSSAYPSKPSDIGSTALVSVLLKDWRSSFTEAELSEMEEFMAESANNAISMPNYPAGWYNGTRYFFNNDDLIKKNDDYHIIVNMSSVRCDGIESAPPVFDAYNFTTCDGLTLFQRSGDEYKPLLGSYDPLQLPGVTARQGYDKLTPVMNWRGYCSKHNYAAAATSGGENAVAGYIFEKMNASEKENVNDPTGANSGNDILYGVQAHKSYFMMGDYFIALGAGVTNLQPEMEGDIHTSIEQTSITEPLYLWSNGKKEALKSGKQPLQPMQWLVQAGKFAYTTLPQYTAPSYYETFERANDWVAYNGSNAKKKGLPAQADVLQIWTDHGQSPMSDSYGYVVYAGEGMPAAKLPFTVLQNDTLLQAVCSTSGDVVAAAFYTSAEILTAPGLGEITVSSPSTLLLEQADGVWTLSVTDAHMDKDLKEITVTIADKTYTVAMPQGNQCGKPAVQVLQ